MGRVTSGSDAPWKRVDADKAGRRLLPHTRLCPAWVSPQNPHSYALTTTLSWRRPGTQAASRIHKRTVTVSILDFSSDGTSALICHSMFNGGDVDCRGAVPQHAPIRRGGDARLQRLHRDEQGAFLSSKNTIRSVESLAKLEDSAPCALRSAVPPTHQSNFTSLMSISSGRSASRAFGSCSSSSPERSASGFAVT